MRDRVPMLTFTAPWRASEVSWRRPAPIYLRLIADGLREAHGWSTERTIEYLAARPGVAGQWDRVELTGLVAPGPAAEG
ncbi:hypothetical protein V6U81_03580 [Micromonospora sp. CPCC 205711]|uniref:hypothetical protein n=1 Tax=Micromonospora sp. CPCC 205547 TaxID=3122400 RepID=UPI002FF129B8